MLRNSKAERSFTQCTFFNKGTTNNNKSALQKAVRRWCSLEKCRFMCDLLKVLKTVQIVRCCVRLSAFIVCFLTFCTANITLAVLGITLVTQVDLTFTRRIVKKKVTYIHQKCTTKITEKSIMNPSSRSWIFKNLVR